MPNPAIEPEVVFKNGIAYVNDERNELWMVRLELAGGRGD